MSDTVVLGTILVACLPVLEGIGRWALLSALMPYQEFFWITKIAYVIVVPVILPWVYLSPHWALPVSSVAGLVGLIVFLVTLHTIVHTVPEFEDDDYDDHDWRDV